MTDEMRKRLADLGARQSVGEHMECPRCGRDAMKQDVYSNALSRYANIMVCDACGLDEALRSLHGNPLPIEAWACFKAK